MSRSPTPHRILGVYVHIPFCERVCPYCDFAVLGVRHLSPEQEDRYVQAVLDEFELRKGEWADHRLGSLYFGGGTPSLLRPQSLARLIDTVCGALPAIDDLEITLELNPSTTERSRLPGFRAAGVTRLSIGIQSFQDALLKRLGRAHRAEEGRAALVAARAAGFDNVSVDVIFAAPGQTLAMLEADLDEILDSAPEHVSAYELCIEPDTPFALADRRGQLARPSEEVAAQMFEGIGERLEAEGLQRYEISSFARPGRTSAHNQRYWQRKPVLGLGVGAWSSHGAGPDAPFGARSANVRRLADYLARVQARERPIAGALEVLPEEIARGEAAFLGLRTTRGVDAGRFASEFGFPPRHFFGTPIEDLSRAGLLEETVAGDLRLTRRGLLLSDSVFERFVASARSTPVDALDRLRY